MWSLRSIIWRIIVPMFISALIPACSTKKNNAATRNYQAFITRYNIHYNGDTHYRETLHDMETKYEDDYTRLVYTHPAEAHADSKAPKPAGDFTRSIEKAQKAIQLRSIKKKPARKPGKNSDPEYKAWMKRDEYNPFLHNSWMMMARSQFMNGDFTGAAATFFYISRHFSWLPETVLEAKLWQARSYCALDWLFDAEMIISKIKPDELTNKTLRSLYNTTWSDYLVRSHKYDEAIPYIREAVKLASGAQKTRLTFLLGQVCALAGENGEAYKAFGKVAGSASSPYRTRFNARIKQTEVYDGADIDKEVKALKRMTRYDRNKEYQDQIFYAIGNLYLSRGDTINAIENYKLAAEKSTRDGIDKAISQAKLGGLYYERHEYDLAQPCYSEAIPRLPESYPDYKILKKRSDILDELAVYSHNVTLQDSLLKLSYLPLEQQMEIIDRIIDELNRKEKEAAEAAAREEFLADQQAQGSQFNQQNAPTTFGMNNSDSWYFYNSATVQAGKTEFQRRWGTRKLEDDWRRRNKASFSFNDFNPGDETSADNTDNPDTADNPDATESEQIDEEKVKREADPHYPEYYLKMIPSDSLSRSVSNDVIQEGLFNMGVILKDKMEDLPAARDQFTTLNTRYPDNVYRLDAYFNMYLIYARENDLAGMERYRQLILSEFPESKQGIALRDPNYIDNLRKMEANENRLYQEAFDAYMDNRNDDVHKIYNDMATEYPMSKLMPKFMFLHALAFVTDHRPDDFKTTLTEMLERYPDTDLSPYASSWLTGLSKGRELQAGSGENMRGLLWDIRLGNDSTALAGSEDAIEFELNPEDAQLLVLLYPVDKISTNELLFNIARHNFSTFAIMDFDLEPMNYDRLGLLIVRGFENLKQINHYRQLMQQNPDLNIPAGVIPVVISEKNFAAMLEHGASFEQYFEFARDKTYRDTEESVLPPELFGPSEGLPEEENDSSSSMIANPEGDDSAIDNPDVINTEATPKPAEQPVPAANAEAVEPAATEAESSAATLNQPLAEPVVKPDAQVEPVQAVEPATQPQTPEKNMSRPKSEPLKPAEPTKPAKPVEPDIPSGSEGDDPLLDF